MKLATAAQMRALDQTAIEKLGIPGATLMENAGLAVVTALIRRFGPLKDQVIPIFVGPGNNGGDGLVVARHIHLLGGIPRLVFFAAPEKMHGDAAANLRLIESLPIQRIIVQSTAELAQVRAAMHGALVLVDALFGTGLARPLIGLFLDAVHMINEANYPVIAIDTPSGLDADRGLPLGASVKADVTVTFALPKPGLVITPGRMYAGTVEVADIGIPGETVLAAPISRELLDDQTVAKWLPHRPLDAHKGAFGHLLVVAGSIGKAGAAMLCGLGALRSGAGLVTLAVPESLVDVCAARLPEAMALPLAQAQDGNLGIESWKKIFSALPGKTALVVGPGLGISEGARNMVAELARDLPLPMVLDADALNILAEQERFVNKALGPRILTPHPGEMARLCQITGKEVQANRLVLAESYAKKNGVCLVLKGAGSIIAGQDGRTAVNPTGNAGMATGGTGDVLAGVIGSLLAQGVSPWEAGCLGAYVHGRAGDLLLAVRGALIGMLASELADQLPLALADLYGKKTTS